LLPAVCCDGEALPSSLVGCEDAPLLSRVSPVGDVERLSVLRTFALFPQPPKAADKQRQQHNLTINILDALSLRFISSPPFIELQRQSFNE
jgi:hypothetical protein